jgi:acid stress chaperone HdeB
MKRVIVAIFTLLPVALAAPAGAQTGVLDLSLLTCKQLLDTPPEQQVLINSWMGGYFSASRNITTIDVRYVDRNVKVMAKYCKAHKAETVMSALQKNWH